MYRNYNPPVDDHVDGDAPGLPCQEKIAFDTQRQAAAAAQVAQYQHGAVLHAYRCRHCSLWHLASGSGGD